MSRAGLLLLLVIVGCGGNVSVDSTSEPSGDDIRACVQACASRFPQGRELFDLVGSQCVCDTCSDACTTEICDDHALPTEACLGCALDGVHADHCVNHEGLFSVCLDPTGPCPNYIACLQACR